MKIENLFLIPSIVTIISILIIIIRIKSKYQNNEELNYNEFDMGDVHFTPDHNIKIFVPKTKLIIPIITFILFLSPEIVFWGIIYSKLQILWISIIERNQISSFMILFVISIFWKLIVWDYFFQRIIYSNEYLINKWWWISKILLNKKQKNNGKIEESHGNFIIAFMKLWLNIVGAIWIYWVILAVKFISKLQ